MLKNKHIRILFIALLFHCNIGFAQVDSLTNLIQQTNDAETKVALMLELATELELDSLDYALEILDDAIQLSKKKKMNAALGKSYLTKGKFLGSEGQFVDAIEYFTQASEAFQEAQDTLSAFESKIFIVRTLGLAEKYSESVAITYELLLEADSVELHQFKPMLLNLIGLGHENLEENDIALEYFLKANAAAIEHDVPEVEMWTYNNISSIYRHKKEFDKSEEMMAKALDLAIRIDHKMQIATCYSNLGAGQIQTEKYVEAEANLLKAYAINMEYKHHFSTIKNTWHLGQLYVHTNRPLKAKKYLNESLALAKKMDLQDDICYAYELLYKAERQLRNYETASVIADSLLFCKEEFYNNSLAEQLEVSKSKYENVLLEKENIQQEAAIEKLHIKNSNNRRLLLLTVLAFSLLGMFLLYFFRTRRAKEKLQLEQNYQDQLTEKIEENRKYRASELHDNIGQQLVLMKQMMDSQGSNDESKQMLEATINQVRSISRDEYPYQLKYLGLKTTLEELIDRIENSSSIIVSEGLDNLPELPVEQSLHLFRIVQECFNNTLKYSGAPSVKITLDGNSKQLEFEYQDSGNSFDFEDKLTTSSSLGLKTILDRVRILKGDIKTLPSKSNGNKYKISIPLHE